MFKKIVRDILILFGVVTLWASTYRPAMKYLSDKRDVNKWWGTYQCLNGDLVSMSYLDFVKEFNPDAEKTTLKRAVNDGRSRTTFYLVGDSYTWHVHDTNFAQVSQFYYINRAPIRINFG